jgi:hypothetical protein
MALARATIPVNVLREAVRAYVAEVTLRPAAKEIGMSSSGLHTFLQGTSPHSVTVRKLTTWYLRRVAEGVVSPTTELLSAALGLLLQPFPSSRQAAIRKELLDVLQRRCEEAGVPKPLWLSELNEEALDGG